MKFNFKQENINTLEQKKEDIKTLFISNAEKHLQDDIELKNAVIDFYSAELEYPEDLGHIIDGDINNEIQKRILSTKENFDDPDFFKKYCEDKIEILQSLTGRINADKREKLRIINNPEATDLEYKLGVYKDTLEEQVADATFVFASKGYLPFESGFDPDKELTQYMGFHNTDLDMPDNLILELEQEGFNLTKKVLSDALLLI